MYVSSSLTYLVRTVILLYLINSTSGYRKQNLTVKNDYTSGISEKARKDFRSPRRSSADKSLRESDHKVNSSLREGYPTSLKIPRGNKYDVDERFEKPGLQNLSTGEAKKNDTNQTGVVKRTKRCLLTMMALGGLASMAADWLLPPEPAWTPPTTTTTTTRPVWQPPPTTTTTTRPVTQPPRPVWQPPPTTTTTTRPVTQPPPPVWQPPPTTTTTTRPVTQPPPPVWQPPPPVWQPPPTTTTTTRPVTQPPPPVWQPPPTTTTTTRPVSQPPPPVSQPPPPVPKPPPTTTTTTRPVSQPPPPVSQPPPPVPKPPPTTTTTTRPVSQPPPPVSQPPPPVSKPPPPVPKPPPPVPKAPPTTTTTTRPVSQPPPPVSQPPPPVSKPPPPVPKPPPPVPKPPPTTTTTTRPVSQPPPPVSQPPPPVSQPPPPVPKPPPTTPPTTTTTTTTTTGPPTTTTTEEPTTTTMKPTIDSTTLLPDVPTTISTPYKLAGVNTSIAPEDPQMKFEEPASEYDRIKLKIIRDKWIKATDGATKTGFFVVDGVPEYDISTAIFVTKTKKNTVFNDIEVLEFVHPLTEKKIIVPLHGGDEYVNPETREVFIIFVDNTGRTFLIFKGIDHSITGKYPDGNSSEDTWNIIVNETTNIERVTKWGSIVVGGVPKYNISEGTIVNKPEKTISLNGIEVLEFVHPFTNETVQVPLNGGDEFVNRKTRKVFIIFVDIYGRTLLIFKGIDHSITGKYPDENSSEDTWNIIVNETTNIERVTKWGSIVVGGVPKYNISEGTIVNKPEKTISLNGIEVLEFVHPFTNETVQVPLNGGDEFVKRQTGEVYIIFVDNQNRTILIFKGIDHSITGKYPDGNSGEDTWNIIVNKTMNIERVTKWGAIVVEGVPKYNISEGTIVNKPEKTTSLNGTEVLEFVHPFTNETVQVPLNGGDEFVNRKTRKVFIIFVDIYGRTLLIFKGIDHSITGKYPDENNSEDTWNIIVNKTTNIERVTKWGSIVVGEVPKYNISEGTIVNKPKKTTNLNGTEVLEFVHPFTNETVQVPLNGGDEFVNRKTRKVFIIFVDIYGRTLLIFKGIDHSITEKYPDENNGEDTWNIIGDETTNIERVTKWGSIVVEGVPKYNISEGTIVNKPEKTTNLNGTEVLEFVHPFTNETVQVPLNGGDEFVNRKTRKVFIIFVDIYGRTLLIFKGIDHSITGKYPDENSSEDTWNIIVNKTTNIERVTKWGSIVVGEVPKYNISEGTIVNKPKKTTNLNGTEVLEFVHPFTNETVQVPLNGGDEFVNRKTRKVFIIFVDIYGRTLLIFKGIDHSITEKYPDENNGEDTWNIIDDETTNIERVTKWGSIVVEGVPKYNISEGTIVNKPEKTTNLNGTEVLEFVHPFTNETVQVPLNGGDEFVNRRTRKVFIIFVDIYGRTLLIFKGIDHSITEKYPDENNGEDTWNIIGDETTNIERVTKWGSIVVEGVPKYNISEGTIVNKPEKTTNLNGTEVLEFVHPFTNETVQVPLNGGDEFVNRKSRKVFIIFVDIYGRTLLIFKGIDHSITEKYPDENNGEDTWNIIGDETTNIERVTKWGSIVVEGVPKYNISEGTIVNKPEKTTNLNGTEVLEFVHPFTNETVQVPLNGGDEFVNRKTRKVFIIFVDIYGRTLLIFKGIDHSITEKYPDENNGEDTWNIIGDETTSIVTKWGSIVIRGVPEYNISEATIVKETEQKTDSNRTEVLEFVHPFTNETVQVPLNRGDEFVKLKTLEVFKIFVDIYGKTLLIFKGIGHSIAGKYPDRNNGEDGWKIIVNGTTNIVRVTKWGSLVVGGVPEYNISEATIVNETVGKTDSNGTEILEFVHPFTNEIVEVPLNGGDEFVKRKTREVYIIFVDNQNRSILIFKGIDHSLPSPGKITKNTDSGENVYEISTTEVKIVKDEWGSLVVDGVPKYDIDSAAIVTETNQMIVNGIPVLEFAHPVTQDKIRVPLKGGDEYINQITKEIFIIFVDILDRTILILRPSDSSVDSDEDSNAKEEYLPQTHQGSIVVGGVPNYDIASAMVVKKTKQRMKNGRLVIDFKHPITSEVIHVALKNGDEYVDPKTKQVFIIFVDILGRTILILKRSNLSIDSQQTDESNVDSDGKFNNYANRNKYKKLPDKKKWGTVVVRGVPKYYMSRAKIVMDVKKKIGRNGIFVLEFKHPITGQTIEVPVNGGDEYVNGQTREVFVICVDRQGRTLLVFKGVEMSNNNSEDDGENSAEFDEDPDLYSNINANVVSRDPIPFEYYENNN